MDYQRVAEAFDAAVGSGDDEAVAALYSADARIWHNTDGSEQTVEENAALSRWLRRKLPDVTFSEVRNVVTATGFVRLSVVRGTTPNGTVIAMPSCIVGYVDAAGKIERIEEYLDPTPLTAALRS